jgi:hypothetical protein
LLIAQITPPLGITREFILALSDHLTREPRIRRAYLADVMVRTEAGPHLTVLVRTQPDSEPVPASLISDVYRATRELAPSSFRFWQTQSENEWDEIVRRGLRLVHR